MPSASTSTCSSSASTPAALVSIVGTMTIVRALSGTPLEKSRRGSRLGPTTRTTARWTHAIAKSLAGSSTSSATSELDERRSARVPGVGDRGGEQERRSTIAIAPR